MGITIDTHSLIWYLDEELNHKLSKNALNSIVEAEDIGIIFVPIVVLMEVLHLSEKGRIKLSFEKMLSVIEKSYNFEIIPFDIKLLKIAKSINGLQVHDRLIVSTSLITKTPLVSNDREILALEKVITIW